MSMSRTAKQGAQYVKQSSTSTPASTPAETADDSDGAGPRLRALRKRHGMTQRDLARRAGITSGAVSMIEQGQVSPSVASLRKLASAMSLTLAEFFAVDIHRTVQQFFPAKNLVEIGGGGVSLRMVPAGVAKPSLQVMRELYAPGSDTGSDCLSHSGEEAGVVVRGRITITVAGQEQELGPGDAYYFDSRLPHRFQNSGEEECEIISSATPPSF